MSLCEQDHRDVGNLAHQLAALGGGMGREDLDALAVQAVVVQRKARALVHGRVVVDDGDLPGWRRLVLGRARVVDHPHDVVVGHSSSASVSVVSTYSSLGAISGRRMRKVVPRPTSDSSRSDPPSRRVTRL